MAELERVQTMVEEVRSELGEPVASFFKNDEIMRWLNYAVKLFARKTRILKAVKATYTWPANTDAVALTTVLPDVYHAKLNTEGTQHDPKIDMAEYDDGSTGFHMLSVSKREIIINEPSRIVTSEKGAPTRLYYSPHDNTLGMQPTPDAAGTLHVYYSYEPAKMVYSDNTYLDANMSRWWEDICAYAIYRGKLKDVDHFAPQEAQESLGRFQSAINMCRSELAVADGLAIIELEDDYED